MREVLSDLFVSFDANQVESMPASGSFRRLPVWLPRSWRA